MKLLFQKTYSFFFIIIFSIVFFDFLLFIFNPSQAGAACSPCECGAGCDVNDCTSNQHCSAKCCVKNSGGGSGGSNEPCKACTGTDCDATHISGCSASLNECNNDCDCGGNCGGGEPTPPPTPSCTVSLSPDPASISVSSTQDYTASVVPANGSVSQVNFSSGSTSIASVSPAADTTSAYNSTATGEVAGTTTLRAGVIMAGSEKCSDTATITVTKPDPWWQVKDADILTNGNLISQIPATLGEKFILQGLGGFPGVAIYGGTTADFSAGSGAGTVSSTGWLGNASTVSQKNFNYKYFAGLIPGDIVFNEITSTSITGSTLNSGGTLSRGYYWYRFDGTTGATINQDLTITSAANLGSRKVILLVKGADLNIVGNINVDDGSGFFYGYCW